MKKVVLSVFVVSVVLGAGGCGRDSGGHEKSGMKCGSGKCGANMIDSESVLEKKRADITAQMREDDPRRDCVVKA